MNQITLSNLNKSFQSGINILQDVSYSFKSNTSYALMGPSGVGKSTLLHMIAGIETPNSGYIAFNDEIITHDNFESRMKMLHKHIGIIFQNPTLINELSVIENVMLTAIARNQATPESIHHAQKLLEEINLSSKANSSCLKLSGGQQQRVAMLRAIFHRPSFIIADEPTGNLDQDNALQVMQLLQSYQKKYAMGLIISTHDIKIAQTCDVILKIEHQKLILQ